jgi:RimJ/RimL family protein N-acetyltransferase
MHKMLVDLPDQLETARLILRGYCAGDGEAYFRLCAANKEHLLPFEAGNRARWVNTVEDAEVLVREYAAAWAGREIFFMGAWEKTTGALVAQVVVMVVNWDLPEFGVGYFVDKAHEGQGFVSEAVRGLLRWCFEELGAKRVRLECNETNVRSVRVAERCGFVREGYLRQTHPEWLRPDGTPSGDYLYGMLREEY